MLARPFALASLLAVAVGCGGAQPPVATPTAAATPGPDPHAIEADEFIVAMSALPEAWTSTVDGWIGKVQKAGEGGGDTTFFLVAGSGREHKGKFYFKSHPATKDELKPGSVIACFRDAKKDDVFHAPASPKASRDGHWMVGHVSDVAELGTGIVKLGSNRCAIDAVRALAPPS